MFIRQDLHLHTNLSRCGQPDAILSSYIDKAKTLGLNTIAITNHLWDHAIPGWTEWYAPQDFDHISKILPEIDTARNCGLRILFGAEVEYSHAHHTIAISEEHAARLDIMLAPNSHVHVNLPEKYRGDPQVIADFMLQATDDILNCPVARYVTLIPHPFIANGCKPSVPEATEAVIQAIGEQRFIPRFERMAKMGIALEINASSLSLYSLPQLENCHYLNMLKLAVKCGCKLTCDTDSHAIQSMDKIAVCYEAASILELSEQDIMNV